MPKLSPGQPFGPIPASVTLDASGNGSVFFQATGSAVSITNLFGGVAPVSPATVPTNQAVVDVYKGTVALSNRVFHNNSGSTGFTASGRIDIPDGTIIFVVWTGGDAGAVATATFSGTAIPFDQVSGGFEMRADDPIAAGDGSLIFPALKSPNYVGGASGWKIDRDGDAEFNDAVIRGTIDIAAGAVIIDNTGIDVIDSNSRYRVDNAVGFRGDPIPATGKFVTLQHPGLYLHPTDPYNGYATDYGTIQIVESNVSGTYVTMVLFAPTLNGQTDPAYIRLWSKSANGLAPVTDIGNSSELRIDADCDITNLSNGVERYGRGRVNLTTSGAALVLTTTSKVAYTWISETYKAGRAYEALVDASFFGGNSPSVQLRKGTTIGSPQVVDAGRVQLSSGSTFNCRVPIIFVVSGGSDVTTQLCITMTSGAINGTTIAAPSRAIINDIGLASDYSDYTATNTLS